MSAMPEIGDQSVMPVHCEMMMPANQIHAAPTMAMMNARTWKGSPSLERMPGLSALISERYSARWASSQAFHSARVSEDSKPTA